MDRFISTTDLTLKELDDLLVLAAKVKSGAVTDRLPGKTLGMVFFNSSLRTRTSFETGMFQLGGHALNLAVGQGLWNMETETGVTMDGDKAEHVREAVPVLSRYVDALAVRCFPFGEDWNVDKKDPVITAFAKNATVPLINMESAMWHPCQALADAQTWNEQGLKKGDRIVVSWAYHPRMLPMAVPNSVVTVAAQRGLDVTVLRPEPYKLDAEVMDGARALAAEAGGALRETDDLDAIEGAKIIYAKSWGSLEAYGDNAKESAIRENLKQWQVTEDWMRRTRGGKFMHCLPVRRNVVVSDSVLDSDASIVVDQAENRLHAQKALLLTMLGK
jgi:N-acetylornithine carbamoyltransferase